MNDVTTKSPGASLTSNDFNATQADLESFVTSSDQTLDPADTASGDKEMVKKAVAGYAGGAWAYTDSGAANAHVVSIASNMEPVTEYFDNLMVAYVPGNTNTSTTVTTNVSTLGAKNIRLVGGGLPPVGSINADKGLILKYNDGAGYFEALVGAGQEKFVQSVFTQTGAVATGTTLIPNDDTIPQIAEGDEYMTRTITPENTTNKLKIFVNIQLANNQANQNIVAGLFRDAVAGSLASSYTLDQAANNPIFLSFIHNMTAPSVSLITFRVRAGADNAGTTTFNGIAGARTYGGVLASSILILETST